MTGSPGVVVIGAGGHAKVVIASLLDVGLPIRTILDEDPDKVGTRILGVRVSGGYSHLSSDPQAPTVIAIGDNRARNDLARRFAGRDWLTVIHPAAYVHPSASVGPGTVAFAGSVVQPGARIGSHCIINTGATVDHDCRIGDFSHIAPGSHLAGGVRVGRGAFLGVGSAAIPNVEIGDWSVVGAGGVVVGDLPPGVTSVGAPAKPLPEND